MKRNLYLLLTVILIIFSFNITVYAAGFSLETGTIDGDSTYIISGPQSGGFKSELIFPIEQRTLKISYQLPLKKYKIAALDFSLLKNMEDESGTFIDSDWLYSYSSEKSIYSESDSYLDFYSADLGIEFLPFYSSTTGNSFWNLRAGYKKQEFDFDIHNLEQINYLTDRESIVPGQVLTYQIEYSFPYFALDWSNEFEKINLDYSLSLGFSPFLQAEDRDDHVLRDKLSYIEADGQALLAEANLNYNLNSSFSFFVAWNYLKLKAEGTQVQKNYSGDILFEDIESELSSKQNIISGGITFVF